MDMANTVMQAGIGKFDSFKTVLCPGFMLLGYPYLKPRYLRAGYQKGILYFLIISNEPTDQICTDFCFL